MYFKRPSECSLFVIMYEVGAVQHRPNAYHS